MVTSLSKPELLVGKRYLNAKTRQPLTLLYIGPLPPISSNSDSSSSSTANLWLGVEYDDPSHGKGHSGTYEGIQVFQSRQEGAGAFIRLRTGNELVEGATFVQAFRERYGLDSEDDSGAAGAGGPLILGSSGSAIVVETPGMEGVQRRLRQLERLKQIGLEDECVCDVGGTEEQKSEMRDRLRGVTLLNLSRNLLTTWEDVSVIIGLLPGLDTLILNGSRLPSATNADLSGLNQLKEIHLARSLISWADLRQIGTASRNLEELHLSDNTSILLDQAIQSPLEGFDNLRVLDLTECGITSWTSVEDAFGHLASLETIDVSGNPLEPIESVGAAPPRFTGSRNLLLLSTFLNDISSLANISDRLPTLTSLVILIDPAVSASTSTKAAGADRLSGHMDDDRGTMIALFPKLEVLNGTDIRGKERDEAERRFVTSIAPNLGDETRMALGQRIEGLARKHDLSRDPTGASALGPSSNPPVQTSLRSKLITLHISPEGKEGFTISLLPSSPIALLKRKIGKKLGLGSGSEEMMIYAVREVVMPGGGDGEEELVRTKEEVVEVDGGEVELWFESGDRVIVNYG